MNTTETFKHKVAKTAEEDSLSRQLFDFERAADHLNAELLKLPTEGQDYKAIFELQAYLRIIARKAAYVASCLNVAAEQKAKDAA